MTCAVAGGSEMDLSERCPHTEQTHEGGMVWRCVREPHDDDQVRFGLQQPLQRVPSHYLVPESRAEQWVAEHC
jgi:hypothetical protein